MTIHGLIEKLGITIDCCIAVNGNPNMDSEQPMHHWRVTLKRKNPRRQFTLFFSQGYGIQHDPTAEGVLECLISDSSGIDQPFDNWASDLGYDTDSRKAEKTYKAVQVQTKKLQQFLGDDFETACRVEF
jgi:hypothetical protein